MVTVEVPGFLGTVIGFGGGAGAWLLPDEVMPPALAVVLTLMLLFIRIRR
ncbi:hypothetical protein AB0G79_20250 [Streptomyces sp. NPDC020807]